MLLWSLAGTAHAFCGYYVGSTTDELYNRSSEVAIARQGTRTTMTFKNQYAGDASDFAVLIPVPVLLTQDDVKTRDDAVIQHLRDYTEPRLVQYYCGGWYGDTGGYYYSGYSSSSSADTGGTVEVYTDFLVGSYEVVILSAQESTGLIDWLNTNGYATSQAARDLLQQYIDEGSYFFAAKVALGAVPTDPGYLEPLQVSYDYPGFGLPIRLGTLNAGGCDQDLILYFLTDSDDGRVKVSGVPEVTLQDDCIWRPEDFTSLDSLYEYEFSTAMDAQPGLAYVTEYGWPSGSCDPCTATVLSQADVDALGYQGSVYNSYTTRLHLRYDPTTVDQELTFFTNHDRATTQERFIEDDPGQRLTYPVCVRGWDQAPTDCDGNVATPGGPGPYLTGDLPPAPVQPAQCAVAPTNPGTGTESSGPTTGTQPDTTPDTTPTGVPDGTTGSKPGAGGKGCGCDGTGSGLALPLLLWWPLLRWRSRRVNSAR